MSSTPPKRPFPLRFLLWILYDVVWIALAALVFGSGILAAAALCRFAYGLAGFAGLAFSALPAYVLFLLVVVLEMGAIRFVSPRVKPGVYKKFKAGPFFALVWLTGLNNLVFAMPFTRTIHFIALLRFLYYRGQGLSTYYENWISPDVTIADPSMITLGRGVNIGGRAAMSGHMALQDRMIIAPIVIGDRAVVGADAKLGPGVQLGKDALVGACSVVSVNVKIGEGAQIEPASYLKSGTIVGAYEVWGGHPAVKTGERPRPAPDPASLPVKEPQAT